MWKHALEKMIGIITYGAWPVCRFCHSAECLDRTYEYNQENGTYYDCLGSSYP